ncbi:MAG TPA: class I SAM-dependent methyltransferase [Bacillota bacterium]|nr:class I SAM-dependent methyltransferase [Bacillota bacterium]
MTKDELIEIFNHKGRRLSKKHRIVGAEYRKQFLQEATGRTLEVAVGPGFNFMFYSPAIELTAIDFSPVLLKIAAERAAEFGLKVNLINSDVESLSFPENSFDTIVSVLTLCAYNDPVKVLRNLNKWCKPEGKILLFEHGIGGGGKIITWFFTRFNNWNRKHNGCYTNLNIKSLLLEAGLVIEDFQIVNKGVHYQVKAKPNKSLTL